jgi:hypothetical protein
MQFGSLADPLLILSEFRPVSSTFQQHFSNNSATTLQQTATVQQQLCNNSATTLQ